MSGGLVALLDDIATLARAAAASVDDIAAGAGRASTKAVGVVVDDAAVTPQYVSGVSPARELPMIWRITKGSLFNKIVIILPIALLLSQFVPWALTPILMLGGSYLCFEGMEKVWEKLSHSSHEEKPAANLTEDQLVKSAILTDLILSAEIMVISLNEVAAEPILNRTIILLVVALAITALVYGVVALLVKIDDIGLHLARRGGGIARFGHALVSGMPWVLKAIGVIGTFAMLWVGGHIVVVGLEEFGFTALYDAIHHLAAAVPGGFLAWLVETAGSLVVGAIWGAVIVAVVHAITNTARRGAGRAAAGAKTPGAKLAQ